MIGWNLHSLANDPANFWNANIFFPTKHALAFSDGLFIQTAMTTPMFAQAIATFPSDESFAKMKSLEITYALFYLDRLPNREEMLNKIRQNAKIEIISEDKNFLLAKVR